MARIKLKHIEVIVFVLGCFFLLSEYILYLCSVVNVN